MTAEKPTAELIRKKALERIAALFNRPVEAIRLEDEFGKDLQPSFVSYWKDNEFDEIEFDIRYVANKKTLKLLEKDILIIRSVADYCEHMAQCHEKNPEWVEVTLGLRRQPSFLDRIKRFFVRS